MRDTRKECIEILKTILEPHIDDNHIVSFIEGERFDYLSSIEIESGIIKFPILQEVFLILYELDDGERILIFFLIILMLENDEYVLCDKLLTILEKKGMLTCKNPEVLHKSILIKQLFTILHECGHYFFSFNEELREHLYEGVSKYGHAIFQDLELHEHEIDEIVNKLSTINPKSEEFARGLLSNILLSGKTPKALNTIPEAP